MANTSGSSWFWVLIIGGGLYLLSRKATETIQNTQTTTPAVTANDAIDVPDESNPWISLWHSEPVYWTDKPVPIDGKNTITLPYGEDPNKVAPPPDGYQWWRESLGVQPTPEVLITWYLEPAGTFHDDKAITKF